LSEEGGDCEKEGPFLFKKKARPGKRGKGGVLCQKSILINHGIKVRGRGHEGHGGKKESSDDRETSSVSNSCLNWEAKGASLEGVLKGEVGRLT